MQIKVNNKMVELNPKKSLLLSLNEKGYHIPHLCYQEGLKAESRCRLCIIEVNGKLKTSCSTYPKKGMVVQTKTKRVLTARRVNSELLMAEHNRYCQDKEVCKMPTDLGVKNNPYASKKNYQRDLSSSVIRDNNLCVNCGRCVQVCANVQATFAIDFAGRGDREHVTPYFEHDLTEVACTKCGQCIAACPVGAISEHEHLPEVLKVLKDQDKHVVVQVAPSIRASIGEEFGMKSGTLVTGKLPAALRRCGFDRVFDTNLGADMTIMEESSELLKRVKKGGPFPMITTCCPAWIKFMEHFFHKLLPNMSTCKSPHEMLGILTKTYYAQKVGINPKKIVVVSIMPCTAKKFESSREELESAVDYVLTTRECAKLFNHFKVKFANLKDEKFDPTLGISTGAGAIFGATGGVMEAALRTAYELGTKKTLKKVDFKATRGLKGIKIGKIKLNGKIINFAVANGLANARELMKDKDKYHFIEVMACPGGCINGGGQPLPYEKEKVEARMKAIYREDAKLPYRKSHKNPIVQQIYKEYLDYPLSKKAEKILHIRYFKRSRF